MEKIMRTLIICIVFTISNLFAQNFTLNLWDEAIPNFVKTDEKEIAETTDGILKISYVQKPNITVYLPARRNLTGEAVIICPGGGYWILAYDWEGTDIAKYFNSKGIAAIVLKYRLPVSKSNVVPHKSPLMDAQQAIRIVRKNAKQWNLNPNKIGIMGFSAGGHLASTVSTHFDYGDSLSSDLLQQISCRPDFSILVYPVISFVADYSHTGSSKALLGENPTKELLEYYSNDLQVNSETPPTILIHSQDDNGVPIEHSLSYFKALTENNIKSELHAYPYGGHGYALAIGKGYLATWPDRVVDWIRNLD
jgi:acetyl esterase/lipase